MAKISQVSVIALAVEELAAQLVLQVDDCPRQRRLRDVSPLGSAREIERVTHREKVANLVHFHKDLPAHSPIADRTELDFPATDLTTGRLS